MVCFLGLRVGRLAAGRARSRQGRLRLLKVLTHGPRTAVLKMRNFDTPHPVHWAQRSIELSGGKRSAGSAATTDTKLELTWE